MKEKIIELYQANKNCAEIARLLNTTSYKIRSCLKKEGIKIRGISQAKTIHTIDENYFSCIDSENKAYWLGLLYADGNVYLKRNRVQITLQNEDSYLLENFAKDMSSTRKLYIDRVKYTKLIVDNKKLVKDLIDKGCVPCKASVAKFPSKTILPEKYQSHFIRGYFDGDGGVSISREGRKIYTNITGNLEFLEEMFCVLYKNNIEGSSFIKRYKHKENSSGTRKIDTLSIEKFYEYLYKDSDSTHCMSRKKEKLLFFIKYRNTNGRYSENKKRCDYKIHRSIQS